MTDVLVLRAYASEGDGAAIEVLRTATRDMAMPGLMVQP